MHPRNPIPFILTAACLALGAADGLVKPASAKICTTCHTTAADNLRGHFDNLALKNSSFQLKIDDRTEPKFHD